MDHKTTIFFRTDGNQTIGFGHFFRSLALAEMLRANFKCIFLLQNTASVLIQELEKYAIPWQLIPAFEEVIEEAVFVKKEYVLTNSIIVLDGYQYHEKYQLHLKQKDNKLVYIADFKETVHADVIINHAGNVKRSDYPTPNIQSIFCLGPKYALLRPVFLKKAPAKIKAKQKRIFVSMGGAATFQTTLNVLSTLISNNKKALIYVVFGTKDALNKSLRTFITQAPLEIIPLFSLTATEMANYMQECEEAICTPSTVAYEYLAIKGGTLYLNLMMDNQANIYNFLIKNNIAFSFNDYDKITAEEKTVALQNQLLYFDGQSGKRFVKIFQKLDYQLHCELRKTEASDFLLYYRWINDLTTRQFSINKEKIPFESHDKWFTQKMEDKDCYMYVLNYKYLPVGQIRFDVNAGQARISYSLDKAFRGKGLGKYLLEKGIKRFQKEYPHKITIIGQVFKQNRRSVYAFRKLGFQAKTTKTADLLEYYLKAS